MTMRAEALKLAEFGFAVFPCAGKHPYKGTRGFLEATTSISESWFQDDANIGIGLPQTRTPDGKVLFGVDLDTKNNGVFKWRDLVAGRDVPSTVRVITGTGGYHFYFYAPTGWTRFPARLTLGIDIKRDGYLIAPPSIHPESKQPYAWEGDPWSTPIADAPAWLLDELEKADGFKPQALRAQPDFFIAGERNNALTSWAGYLRRKGATGRVLAVSTAVYNEENMRPPLDDREVSTIVASADRNFDAADPIKPGTLVDTDVDFDLDGEDEPVKWLCEGLRLAPGRPSVWVGEGGTGKSLMAHWLGLCVADGRQFLGRDVSAGRALYVDFDGQGKRLTKRRHKRMGRAMGLDVEQLKREKKFGYLFRPKKEGKPVHLDSYEREQAFADLIAGFDLVIIDSLRRCAPRLNEDKPEASLPLELAASISERTGQVFIFLDHAGKPNADPSAQKSRRHVQRGSSAKRDGSGTQVVMSNTKGKPTLVTCERDQETGKEFPDFAVEFVDVASLGDPEHALALREVPTDSSGLERASTRIKKEILEYIKAHPGCSWAQVRADVPGKDVTKKAMLDELVEEKRLTNLGTDKKGDYRAV